MAATPHYLRELQAEFARFLTGTGSRIAGHVVDAAGLDADNRLDIYATAYRQRLREALATDHEILWRYLGDALFDELVATYIAAQPSHHPSLRHYGDALPGHLASTEPFRAHPLLSELAAFERGLLDVFDAGDRDLIEIDDLRGHATEAWPDLSLQFHPSVRLFSAKLNSVETWKALHANHAPPPVQHSPLCWLLWRGRERLSEFRPLSAQEQGLLSAALGGANFATLCEQLSANLPEADTAPAFVGQLSGWLSAGLVTGILPEGN
jgi:hypothetical protein